MADRAEYRRKAQEAVAQSELLRDPQDRACLLIIAKAYLSLADRVDKRQDYATAHATSQ
jgi:hypothetical protein